MKLVPAFVTAISVTATGCYAGVDCGDWIKRRGYCVDYVKTRVPAFPVPQSAGEVAALNNREIPDISEGDVAIFRYSNYWHVAYVEKVHLDKEGKSTAIDISEMNFGRKLSSSDYKKIWGEKSDAEWKRAVSCGVTHKYGRKGSRKKVDLDTVRQVWSPASAKAGVDRKGRVKIAVARVRGMLSRFFLRLQRKEQT